MSKDYSAAVNLLKNRLNYLKNMVEYINKNWTTGLMKAREIFEKTPKQQTRGSGSSPAETSRQKEGFWTVPLERPPEGRRLRGYNQLATGTEEYAM